MAEDGTLAGPRLGRYRRRAGGLTALTLACFLAAPALAGVTAACRVPDLYLRFPTDLKRTERLIDLKRPIRILVVGPAIEGPSVTERRHPHLAQALGQRLPDVAFEILDGWHGERIADEDFDRLRSEVAETQPDLILWQVGTPDALASSDLEEFGGVLTRAAQWAKDQGIDFVFIDPPYLPHVPHEPLYGKMVLAISTVSDGARINLFRRYAAMQYLERAQPKPGTQRPHCMSELLAEAIVRAVTR
jgi:acyl-CoA thioesterase-1